MNSILTLEDNNGGDIIEIVPLGDDIYELKVGHNCVWVVDIYGTVSDIVRQLTKKIFEGEKR